MELTCFYSISRLRLLLRVKVRGQGQGQQPLIRPFSCRLFMDGRRLMNFFSLFFTLLLSESSELLCFSLELLKTSAGSDETAQLGRCRRLLKVTQLLTDGAPVGLVPMLEARGAGRMFGEGSASGQALHAGGPLQGKALLPPLLEGNNHQL